MHIGLVKIIFSRSDRSVHNDVALYRFYILDLMVIISYAKLLLVTYLNIQFDVIIATLSYMRVNLRPENSRENI